MQYNSRNNASKNVVTRAFECAQCALEFAWLEHISYVWVRGEKTLRIDTGEKLDFDIHLRLSSLGNSNYSWSRHPLDPFRYFFMKS